MVNYSSNEVLILFVAYSSGFSYSCGYQLCAKVYNRAKEKRIIIFEGMKYQHNRFKFDEIRERKSDNKTIWMGHHGLIISQIHATFTQRNFDHAIPAIKCKKWNWLVIGEILYFKRERRIVRANEKEIERKREEKCHFSVKNQFTIRIWNFIFLKLIN